MGACVPESPGYGLGVICALIAFITTHHRLSPAPNSFHFKSGQSSQWPHRGKLRERVQSLKLGRTVPHGEQHVLLAGLYRHLSAKGGWGHMLLGQGLLTAP